MVSPIATNEMPIADAKRIARSAGSTEGKEGHRKAFGQGADDGDSV
jgi:hypothetical protein